MKLKDMFDKLIKPFQDKYVHKSLIFLVDELVSIFATILAFISVSVITGDRLPILFYLYLSIFSSIASFLSIMIARTYVGAIRHTTIIEVWRLVGASLMKSGLLCVFLFALNSAGRFEFSSAEILLAEALDILLTFVLYVIVRAFVSYIYKIFLKRASQDSAIRVLVYGTGDESVSVASMLIKSRDYIFEGYVTIDTSISFSRRSLSGYDIYCVGTEKKFEELLDSKSVRGVVFPSYHDARNEQDRMLAFCAKSGIATMVASGVSELNEGGAILPPVREVRIEDLLGRDQVEINMDEIRSFLTDKVVMVTGAAGSIGSELCRQLLRIPIQKLILFDAAETPMNDVMIELKDVSPNIEKKFVMGDVRQRPKMEYVFKRYQPNVVFHAAAYKHVPMMESNPVEAVNTNVFGTINVANMSLQYGVEKFVMISTDKAVNPANVMGASKRIAEIYIQSLSRAVASGTVKGYTKFVTTRFGNVLGSNGSVIPLFKKQIAAGGPVTVTDPRIIRYFMTIPEACRLVLEAATMGKEDEIFVFDMGDPVKIADLAKNMITLAGLEVDKDIKIKYVGLRPGEKLYEELLSNEENTVPTEHKKIFLAKVRKYEYQEVKDNINKLKCASETMDKEETVAIMKNIVPEFKSCNSRYGRLDK